MLQMSCWLQKSLRHAWHFLKESPSQPPLIKPRWQEWFPFPPLQRALWNLLDFPCQVLRHRSWLRGNSFHVEITHSNMLRETFLTGIPENICLCVLRPWATEWGNYVWAMDTFLPVWTSWTPLTAFLGSLQGSEPLVCTHISHRHLLAQWTHEPPSKSNPKKHFSALMTS